MIHCRCYEVCLLSSAEQSSSERSCVLVSAIFVFCLAVLRLVMVEIPQMCLRKLDYFTDRLNWMELLMAILAILFAFVFLDPCLCAHHWQWQIGAIAVFLAWIDFWIFLHIWPSLGIYGTMFSKIVSTFFWILPLTITLVVAFGLGFYMVFFEPGILVSSCVCKLSISYHSIKY